MYDNIELVVSTITFMFIFGFIRPILLGEKLDSMNAVVTTVMFFFWYFFTINLTNILAPNPLTST